MEKTYFSNGVLQVTDKFVRARNRSIKVSTIESVDLSRRLFFLCAGFFGSLLLFVVAFSDILYTVELVGFAAVAVAALFGSWNVGTLSIFSKLTGSKGWSVTWWRPTLVQMRAGIEKALAARRAQLKAKGGAVDDDDDDEDDAG